MKKELLLSLTFATSFNCFADWQDTANIPPEAPPEELAARAAAAAPGAAPSADNAVATPTSITAPPPATPAPAPAPAQEEVQPAPVAAPVDDIKSLTPDTPAPRMPKSTSIVLHPAILRTRPTASSTGDGIEAETRVRMESTVTNADGTWWFVTAAGIGGGWLLETELGDPQN